MQSGETSGDGNGTRDEGSLNQPSPRYTALPPLEDITEDDEAQEQEEAREQVSRLPETTRVKYNDFNGALEVCETPYTFNILARR